MMAEREILRRLLLPATLLLLVLLHHPAHAHQRAPGAGNKGQGLVEGERNAREGRYEGHNLLETSYEGERAEQKVQEGRWQEGQRVPGAGPEGQEAQEGGGEVLRSAAVSTGASQGKDLPGHEEVTEVRAMVSTGQSGSGWESLPFHLSRKEAEGTPIDQVQPPQRSSQEVNGNSATSLWVSPLQVSPLHPPHLGPSGELRGYTHHATLFQHPNPSPEAEGYPGSIPSTKYLLSRVPRSSETENVEQSVPESEGDNSILGEVRQSFAPGSVEASGAQTQAVGSSSKVSHDDTSEGSTGGGSSTVQGKDAGVTSVEKPRTPSVKCTSELGLQFLKLAELKEISLSSACKAVICFGESPISRKNNGKSYFWFGSVMQNFNIQCYNSLEGYSQGDLLAKSIGFVDHIVLLIMPPKCVTSMCHELQAVIAISEANIPPSCLALIADPNVVASPVKHLVIFYVKQRQLVEHEKECHDAISELVYEKNMSTTIDTADGDVVHNEVESVAYHTSSTFPFEDPCSFASFTTTLIEFSVFIRKDTCRSGDYIGEELLQAMFLYMRRPIYNSGFYSCLNPEEIGRTKKRKFELDLTLKYLVSAAWESGDLELRFEDLVCHKNVRLLSFSRLLEGQRHTYIYTYPINNTQILSDDKVIGNADQSDAQGSNLISIPAPEQNFALSVSTDRTAWCDQGNGAQDTGRDVGVTLALLSFYNSSLSDACRKILCNSTAVTIDGGYLRTIFMYHLPLTPSDEVCFQLAKEFGGATFVDNKIHTFATTNLPGFPVIAVWASPSLLSSTLIYMSVNLLLSGETDRLRCLHRSLDQDVAYTKYPHYAVSVEENEWRNCLMEGRNQTETEDLIGISEWFEDLSFRNTPWVLVVSKKVKGSVDLSLLSYLIARRIVRDAETLEFIFHAKRTRINYSTTTIFVLQASREDSEKYIDMVDNPTAFDCVSTVNATLCQDKQNPLEYVMFIHKCHINFEDEAKLQIIYQFVLSNRSLSWELCSEATVAVTSKEYDYKVLHIQPRLLGSNINQSVANLQNLTEGWMLEENNYIIPSVDAENECLLLPRSVTLEVAFKIWSCLIIHIDDVQFFVKRKISPTQYFVLMDEKNDGMESENSSSISAYDLPKMQTLLDTSVVNDGFINDQSLSTGSGNPIKNVHSLTKVKVYHVYMNNLLNGLVYAYGEDVATLISNPEYVSSSKTMLDFVSNAIVSENEDCILDVVNGKTMVIEKEGITYLTGAFDEQSLGPCYSDFKQNFIERCETAFVQRRGTINKFWPFCGSFNAVVLGTMSSEWHYLTTGCRAVHIFFLVLSVIITVVTIGGNFFVIFIMQRFRMFNGGEYRRSYVILRSLALADLLKGLFPGTLWVYDQISLMSGTLTLRDLEGNGVYGSFRNLSLHHATGLPEPQLARYGYPMFCSLVIGASSFVSLLTLFSLGFERYKSVKARPLNMALVVVMVLVAWIVSLILASLLFFREDGFIAAGYFEPVSKLTLSVRSSRDSVPPGLFFSEVAFFTLVGVGMVVMTFYSIYMFISFKKKCTDAEGVARSEKKRLKEDVECSSVLMTLMLLYLLSALPLCMVTFLGSAEKHPELQILTWWLFMAGSSWNWYVYTFNRKTVRDRMRMAMGQKRRQNDMDVSATEEQQCKALKDIDLQE
ncbi:uncharacterized protein LOC143039979 [Oratosquilla oratoria]|uniref:uncharacterized protein LOC143039979 n=1 Tax=Oratosquilla oratoria TaxID=337810 RepID=UPI003F76218F